MTQTNQNPLIPEQEALVTTLTRLADDFYTGRGFSVGFADLKALGAFKTMKCLDDWARVAARVVVKSEVKHPTLLNDVSSFLSESLVEKIRRYAGAKAPIDVEKV